MTEGRHVGRGDRGAAGRRVCAVAGLLLAAALTLSAAGVSPFRTWAYQAAWYPLLLLLDGGYAWRSGSFALLGRPRFAASLFLWSAPAWFVFEALNLRLGNWFYVNVPADVALRWGGYGLAFATVLPAVYLPDRWLARWIGDGDASGPSLPVGRAGRRAVGLAGVLFLALPLWRPDRFYPLVWGATALLLAPWNHARDPAGSLLGDLERGRYGRILRLLLAGLAAGLLWESLNAVAGARWIYTVPGLETGKLFEMPLPGFVGFTAFGVECRVTYRALVNARVAVPGWGREDDLGARAASRSAGARHGRTALAALLAAVFCAAASAGVDRWTVASRRAPRGGAAVAPADTAPASDVRAARRARLAELRGLGPRNASRLVEGGVADVCGLAEAREDRVVELLRGGSAARREVRVRRVRVWQRAARERCATGAGSG